MQVREKVGKSRNIVFFQWYVAPEGRKVGSLKRRVRSQLARWEMKNCTPLWREAHPSQNVQNTSTSDHFWKLRCRKSARCCGPKHISKSNCRKHTMLGPLLEIEMSKKCTPLQREAHFEVKMLKTPHPQATFGRSDAVSRGRRKGLWTLSKVGKTWRFFSVSKNDGRHGTFEAFSVAGAVQETCSSALLGEVRALISWEGLHFVSSDFQVCWDDFVWQVQHFVWPGLTFSWHPQ